MAAQLARQNMIKKRNQELGDGAPSAAPGESDDYYQKPNQNDALHNRFLNDREEEKRKKGNQRSIGERIMRTFGWHPPKKKPSGEPDAIRLFIEAREAANRGIIDPRTSAFVNNWDMVVMVLLFFTTLVTPYEVVFMEANADINALFVINRIVDIGFLYDMKIQFNLAFQLPMIKGGHWVTQRK